MDELDIPSYPTAKEWAKDVKFNKHWYHLRALFDDTDELFDFNSALVAQQNTDNILNNYNDSNFDFNLALTESTVVDKDRLFLEQYGLYGLFSAINEDNEIDKQDAAEIQKCTTKALKDIEKIKGTSFTKQVADKLKSTFSKNKRLFFTVACGLCLLTGNTSASLAGAMENYNENNNSDKPRIEVAQDIIGSGGVEIEHNIIKSFINTNFDDLPKEKKKQMMTEILDLIAKGDMKRIRYFIISDNFPTRKEALKAAQNISSDVKLIKSYVARDHESKTNKYQTLTIYER